MCRQLQKGKRPKLTSCPINQVFFSCLSYINSKIKIKFSYSLLFNAFCDSKDGLFGHSLYLHFCLGFSEILSVEDASSVVLAFFLANIIVWFALDVVVFEKYTRYIFSIYPLLILVSAGLVDKLRTPFTFRNLVFSAVTLGFCLFAFIFRIFFFMWRWRSRRKAETAGH